MAEFLDGCHWWCPYWVGGVPNVVSGLAAAAAWCRRLLHGWLDERDALGEGESPGEIDGVGGLAHVGLPRIRARFASAAGFLFTAKGAADLRARGPDVHVGDAAVR